MKNTHFFFLPLDYPPQKRKSPVKSIAAIGGALHSLLGFLFTVSSMQEEIKDLCSISPLGERIGRICNTALRIHVIVPRN
ncbi:MAG: hypothetical protein ACLUJB_14000, partial [Coprobacillus cateniformis]